jgi:hypothetical protein
MTRENEVIQEPIFAKTVKGGRITLTNRLTGRIVFEQGVDDLRAGDAPFRRYNEMLVARRRLSFKLRAREHGLLARDWWRVQAVD